MRKFVLDTTNTSNPNVIMCQDKIVRMFHEKSVMMFLSKFVIQLSRTNVMLLLPRGVWTFLSSIRGKNVKQFHDRNVILFHVKCANQSLSSIVSMFHLRSVLMFQPSNVKLFQNPFQ